MLEAGHEGSETQLGATMSRNSFLNEDMEHLDFSDGHCASSFATPNNSSFTNDKRSDEDNTDYDEPASGIVVQRPKSKKSIMDFFGDLSRSQNNHLAQDRDTAQHIKTFEPALGVKHKTLKQMNKENTIKNAVNITNLEQKFYDEGIKSVTAKEFLASFGPSARKTLLKVETDKRDNSKTSTEVVPEPIIVDEDITEDIPEDIMEVESKIYNNATRRMSARDYLMLKPKRKSYFAVIKLPSSRLREIAEPKVAKSLVVKLKVDAGKLKQLSNPLFSRGTNSNIDLPGTSAKLLFQLMMQRATAIEPRLSPLQKLKELEPPIILRDSFHVRNVELEEARPLTGLKPRKTTVPCISHEDYFDGQQSKIFEEPREILKKQNGFQSFSELKQYVENKVPSIHSYSPLTSIYNRIEKVYSSPQDPVSDCEVVDLTREEQENHKQSDLLWTDQFAPRSSTDVLVDPAQQRHLRTWITTTLDKLKSQSSSNFKRSRSDTLDDFIDDTEIDDEEPTYPIMILVGPHGCGKSSAVYAAAQEFNGYVHEVNTGQGRGRKDILSNIKEIATTHLVHRSNNEVKGDFQKGILLFEDCDILFDQDKTFWSVIYETMDVTRRPIILTCHDMSMIPNNILNLAQEAGTILDFSRKGSKSVIKDYIWLCGISQGFDIDDSILSKLDPNDLRLGLMSTQVLCNSKPLCSAESEITLTSISFEAKDIIESGYSLESVASQADALSLSDVIGERTKSQFQHSVMVNEFVDQNIIDETSLLQLPSLPFEPNFGHILYELDLISWDGPQEPILIPFNYLRDEVITFVSSRSRKLTLSMQEYLSMNEGPRNTRSLSRSPTEWTPEPIGIDENSIGFQLSCGPFMTDFFPVVQLWALFQISLDKTEAELLQSKDISVKRFLRWRQFQHNPQHLLRLGLSQARIHSQHLGS